MKPNVNPLCLPQSRGEGEVIKFLTLRYVDEGGINHEVRVRAFAGCEEGGEKLSDTWQWSANTRDDMERMGLVNVFDDHHEAAAGQLTLEPGSSRVEAMANIINRRGERSREKVIDDVTPYAVVVVVVKKGLVLLGRFTSDASFDGMLPGGKLEPGETPHQAAIREFKEECGAYPVKVNSTPALVAETHDGRPMWVFFGEVSERDFPLDDWQYVGGEGYVRWVELADVLDYYRPQLRDAAKKIFSAPMFLAQLARIKDKENS